MRKIPLIFCKFIVCTNYSISSVWPNLFAACEREIRDETTYNAAPTQTERHKLSCTCKQSLRLLMPLHQKNITATWYISEMVLFCSISQRSRHCQCSLPIFLSFTTRIVRQPYEPILPAVEPGNSKWDKIYNILQWAVKKKKKDTFPGRSVAGHSCWQECSSASLLFSQERVAVISVFNQSTETFFKNANEKQLEWKKFVVLCHYCCFFIL